jgi:hypothetical protein
MISFARSRRVLLSPFANRPARPVVAVVRPGTCSPDRREFRKNWSVIHCVSSVVGEGPSRAPTQLDNPGAPCVGASFRPLPKHACQRALVTSGRRTPARVRPSPAKVVRSCTSMSVVPISLADTNSRR